MTTRNSSELDVYFLDREQFNRILTSLQEALSGVASVTLYKAASRRD